MSVSCAKNGTEVTSTYPKGLPRMCLVWGADGNHTRETFSLGGDEFDNGRSATLVRRKSTQALTVFWFSMQDDPGTLVRLEFCESGHAQN